MPKEKDKKDKKKKKKKDKDKDKEKGERKKMKLREVFGEKGPEDVDEADETNIDNIISSQTMKMEKRNPSVDNTLGLRPGP